MLVDTTITVGIGKVQGISSVTSNFKGFSNKVMAVMPDAVEEGLTPTLELARDVYCPIETGALRGSGYVEARTGGHGIEAEIGFGRGGIPDYAIMVHENPAAYHQPPTTYKFLERAVNEDSPNIMDRIFKSAKSKLGL